MSDSTDRNSKSNVIDHSFSELARQVTESIVSFTKSLQTYCETCPELQKTEKEDAEKGEGEEGIPCYKCVIQKIIHEIRMSAKRVEEGTRFKTSS